MDEVLKREILKLVESRIDTRVAEVLAEYGIYHKRIPSVGPPPVHYDPFQTSADVLKCVHGCKEPCPFGCVVKTGLPVSPMFGQTARYFVPPEDSLDPSNARKRLEIPQEYLKPPAAMRLDSYGYEVPLGNRNERVDESGHWMPKED